MGDFAAYLLKLRSYESKLETKMCLYTVETIAKTSHPHVKVTKNPGMSGEPRRGNVTCDHSGRGSVLEIYTFSLHASSKLGSIHGDDMGMFLDFNSWFCIQSVR